MPVHSRKKPAILELWMAILPESPLQVLFHGKGDQQCLSKTKP